MTKFQRKPAQRATVRDVRRTNQSVLLRELFFGGPTSRQELADATGLSAGTVTTVLTGLLDDGLVREAGTEESDGGRPRVLLAVAPNRAIALGIDVGETRVRVEAFDLALRKLGGEERLVGSGARQPDEVVDAISDAVNSLLAGIGGDEAAIAGVGVGVSGIVDDEGRVDSASIGWQLVPLRAMLAERLRVPIRIDNGAKAMGQAEMWFGAGRGARNATLALLGTGVGAAVFTNGELYRGAFSSAGEWGHIPVVLRGEPCRCGARGCLEAYVGAGAIARRWAEISRLAGRTDQEAAIDNLCAALGHDPRADDLAADLAEYLGAGLGSLINLFNPERIVIGGWVGLALGPALLELIRERARSYALARPYEQVEIVLGQLGSDAVALGGATLIVDAILAGHLPLPPRHGADAVAVRKTVSA